MPYGESRRKSSKEKITGNIVKPDKITDELSTNYDIKIELVPVYYRNKSRKSTKGLITVNNSFIDRLFLPKNKRTDISGVDSKLQTFEIKIKLVPKTKHISIDSETTMKFPVYGITVGEIPVDFMKPNFVWSNIGNTETLSLSYVFDMEKVYKFIFDHIVDTSTVLNSPDLFNRIAKFSVRKLSQVQSIDVFNDEDDVEEGEPSKDIHSILIDIKNDIEDNSVMEALIEYVL